MTPHTDFPEVLPAARPASVEAVLPVVPRAGPPAPWWDQVALRWGRAIVGWLWIWVVGAYLCAFPFVLALGVGGAIVTDRVAPDANTIVVLWYLTAVVALGWTFRWMQAVVLRGWWRRSPKRDEMRFDQFCDSLGPDGPAPRPRWFLRQRLVATLTRPGPGGRPASTLRRFGRALTLPWHSLWRNFKTGLAAAFCTYLLTGWGCLLMMWSWEFGWLNSINRYYEQAWVGPVTGLLGSLLLILALFYVPMAQAHQAATGQARAFFDFHFVRRLVRARLTAYLGLALLFLLASFGLSIVVGLSLNQDLAGNAAPTVAEGLPLLLQYYFAASFFFLFPAYLLLHWVAALIYRSAVLKVLRQGLVTQDDLNPVLRGWLDRLGLRVLPRAEATGLTWYARLTARFAYRRVVFALLFVVWMAFVFRYYAQHFFVAHPVRGFLNHPMVQLPTFNFTPEHLYAGSED